MHYLCFDTETSGLPLFKKPSDDPEQPFIVLMALLTLDAETLEEIEADRIVLRPPPGRTIPPETTAIHGYTTEQAIEEGIPAAVAIERYANLRSTAAGLIAHNAPFDVRMARIELLRAGHDKAWIETLEATSPVFCTQRLSTDVLKIPPTSKMMAAGFRRHKSPSLAECIRGILLRDPETAHGAMADARACADVFRWLRAHGHIASP